MEIENKEGAKVPEGDSEITVSEIKKGYTYKVCQAQKIMVQEDNSELISVQFEILKDGEVVTTLRHGFPLEAEVEDIEKELQSVADTWAVDVELGEKGAALEKANAKADATIERLVGGEKINNVEKEKSI